MHLVWLHHAQFPIMLQDLQVRGQIREWLALVGRQESGSGLLGE